MVPFEPRLDEPNASAESANQKQFRKAAPVTRRLFRLFPILVHVLSHLKMMLERREGFTRPILQLRIVPAFRVTLVEGGGVLMCADLDRIILACEIFRFCILQLVQLLL